MTTVRLSQVTMIALGISVAIFGGAPIAFAQTSVKAVFEKHKLLGAFAWDCSKPASKNNLYYVNRLLDGDRVQRDQMSGPTTRDWVAFLDKAAEMKANEIALSGTRDGKPTDGIWRIEPNRMLQWEATFNGEKVIGGGRLLRTGIEMPWIYRCED